MAYLRGLNHTLFKILTTKASVSPLRNLYQNFSMPRSAFALIPGPSDHVLSQNIRLRAEVGWGEEVLTRRGFVIYLLKFSAVRVRIFFKTPARTRCYSVAEP